MTKKELIKMVENMADDEEVIIVHMATEREYNLKFPVYRCFDKDDKIVSYTEAKEKIKEKDPNNDPDLNIFYIR